jgi:hypothetical protein
MKKNVASRLLLLTCLIGSGAFANSLASSVDARPPYQMDFTGGMILDNGTALPGIEAKLTARLNTNLPLYAGGEFGFFLLSTTNNSAAVLPILGTIYTPFEVAQRVSLRMGISAGPVLATGGGYATARFAFLFDPTVLIAVADSVAFNAQVRFGVIGSDFVAIPEVGLTFSL